jgi:thioredoxin reductase (NADPH)
MSERTDIVVVGAGPCGLAVGAAARQGGIRAVLIDRGCITQSLVDYPTYMSFFSTADKLEIGGIPFIVASEKPTRRDALVYYRRVARHFELDVRQYEEVVSLSGREGEFHVRTRTLAGLERDFQGWALVLATGSFHAPNRLDVPGEDLAKVTHY